MPKESAPSPFTPVDILIDEGGLKVMQRVGLYGDPTPPPYDQDEEEVWPPHDGSGPDVSNLGNEAETTGLDEHGDPL